MGKKHQALDRIAEALERLSPPNPIAPDFLAPAYLWRSGEGMFEPIFDIKAPPLNCLVGINRARDALHANSLQFARGKTSNNVLLWGARGMGKSSLIKAVFEDVRAKHPIYLIEILHQDLSDLGQIMRLIANKPQRVIIFCDDMSFEHDESSYKSLKAALDGGISGRPENVLFYVTSNRRHLMAREMIENERVAAIHEGEVVDEKVSLSDRFGLWLGFYGADQDDYFEMIRRYFEFYGLDLQETDWKPDAIEWSMTRGARSGRVAMQFVIDYMGKR